MATRPLLSSCGPIERQVANYGSHYIGNTPKTVVALKRWIAAGLLSIDSIKLVAIMRTRANIYAYKYETYYFHKLHTVMDWIGLFIGDNIFSSEELSKFLDGLLLAGDRELFKRMIVTGFLDLTDSNLPILCKLDKLGMMICDSEVSGMSIVLQRRLYGEKVDYKWLGNHLKTNYHTQFTEFMKSDFRQKILKLWEDDINDQYYDLVGWTLNNQCNDLVEGIIEEEIECLICLEISNKSLPCHLKHIICDACRSRKVGKVECPICDRK